MKNNERRQRLQNVETIEIDRVKEKKIERRNSTSSNISRLSSGFRPASVCVYCIDSFVYKNGKIAYARSPNTIGKSGKKIIITATTAKALESWKVYLIQFRSRVFAN